MKNFVSCKTRPSPNLVIACYPLLSQVNLDTFQSSVLGALQKAMLRNPEIILETVGLVISGVNIDLSSSAVEISKNIIGEYFKYFQQIRNTLYFSANLYSKDDKARKEAADACKQLAKKIQDQRTLEDVLQKCFAVFHGSEGKLTVVDHKISVLEVNLA